MPYRYPLKYGKYLLTRRVAVGGMAEVFKAKLLGPRGFEKVLAVKRILPEFGEDEDFVQMFVDEARISSSLHHSNIVQVYDFGEVEGSYYMAMEYVDGPNLRNLFRRALKQNGKFPQNLATHITLEVARALDYAHNVKLDNESVLNLVHRDISPQNILIARSGEVKLTDFGIAKATIKLSKTQPGKVQGKLSYMSPEQATGRPLDRRSDIFSLGIIYYELLSAIKVYGGDNTGEKYSKIRDARIAPIGTVVENLPNELNNLLMSMLSKDPQERPSTCGEIIDILSKFVGKETYESLTTQLIALVSDLTPQENSDTQLEKKLAPFQPRTDHPHTQVRDQEELQTSSTEPQDIADKTHDTQTQNEEEAPKPLFSFSRWVWGALITLLMGASTYFYLASHPSLFNVVSKPTPTPEGPVSGPVDMDLVQKSQERQAEVEARLKALEEEVMAAQERAEVSEMELEAARAQLNKKNTPSSSDQPAEPKASNDCPTDMVYISQSSFAQGSDPKDPERIELIERKLNLTQVSAFCIDQYEYPNQKGSPPKVKTTWTQARDTCRSMGKRLCTQEEWERSCKGPATSLLQDQRYAYGKTFHAQTCNTRHPQDLDLREAQPSGSFEDCQSVEGVFDLSGNVEEWTLSRGVLSPSSHVVKGGSSSRPGYQSRCASIREVNSEASLPDLGFRCCQDI